MVSDSDWRTMVAMESFRKQYEQQHEFMSWLQNERPLLDLPSFQQILDVEDCSSKLRNKNQQPASISLSTLESQQQSDLNTTRMKVGMVQGYQPYPFEIDISKLMRHAAFLGGSGSGKTTLALNIIEHLLLQGIPAILLDRKGGLCSYARDEAWRNVIADPIRAEMRKKLHDSVEVAVYTPGAIEERGRSLSIPIVPKGLGSLSSGEREQLANQAAFSLGRIMGYKDHGQDKARIIILGRAISILA